MHTFHPLSLGCVYGIRFVKPKLSVHFLPCNERATIDILHIERGAILLATAARASWNCPDDAANTLTQTREEMLPRAPDNMNLIAMNVLGWSAAQSRQGKDRIPTSRLRRLSHPSRLGKLKPTDNSPCEGDERGVSHEPVRSG